MDFWSVLEYQLLYKKDVKGADKVGKELKSYSEKLRHWTENAEIKERLFLIAGIHFR